jgi:hypothetical protein
VRTIQHGGLAEALIDWGSDQSTAGLVLEDAVVPTLDLGSVFLNYEPAIRARLHMTADLAAGGAGVFNGLSIQSSSHGFWLLEARAITSGLCIFVDTIPLTNNVGVPSFNMVGQIPGEVGVNFANQFLGISGAPARLATTAIAPLTSNYRVNASGSTGSFCPLWVPGNTWLNLEAQLGNVAWAASVAIQVPSLNPGRFP